MRIIVLKRKSKAKFKNLPVDKAINLEDLIETEENLVVSKAISKGNSIQAMLLGLSAGEIISEEVYLGDTFYQVIKGKLIVNVNDKDIELTDNEVLVVKEHQDHKLSAVTDLKLMQITMINEEV